MFQCDCREANQVNCSNFYLYFSKHTLNVFFLIFLTQKVLQESRPVASEETPRCSSQFLLLFIFIESIKFGLFHSGLYLFNRAKLSLKIYMFIKPNPGGLYSRSKVILR